MLRKIKKLWVLLKYFFTDEDNLFLHLMEIKAMETLEDCARMEVDMTEEVEDLIFHIRSYYDIPFNIAATSYPDLEGTSIKRIIKGYDKGKASMEDVMLFADYLEDVEKQRAVERDIIFEYAKILAFGFKL